MEEASAARLLQKYFPYSVISRVPLFRADTLDTHLYAHQLDFLIHLQKGEQQRLIIIECKNNPLKRFHMPSAKPIDENSTRWFAHYFGNSKDAKKQVRSQAGALFQILDLQRRKGPSIEGWIVHSGKHPHEICDSSDPYLTLTAMTEAHLIDRLDRTVKEGWNAHTLLSSEYLWELHLGSHMEHLPHPVFADALTHVENSHRAVDRAIYVKLGAGKKRRNWAISGSAGAGKSVLMSYTLCVFGSDYWIHPAPRHSFFKILCEVDDTIHAQLPERSQRKICAFARSDQQVEALKRYYDRFVDEFKSLATSPGLQWAPVEFARWAGVIPPHCNILAIDEAQDLTLEDQKTVARWWHSDPNRYLIVAIDRQQQLHQSVGTPKIIYGLDFSGRTSHLNRSYRQPFPAAICGVALLFRWFSKSGPMIRPAKEATQIHYTRKESLRGCLGAIVDTDELTQNCQVSMRNDSHPANHWRRTVDRFPDGNTLIKMFQLQKVNPESVFWIRFSDPTTPNRPSLPGCKLLIINPDQTNTMIDHQIKGLEYPIVVIEGMPSHIDDLAHPEKMWMARRQLYLCTSRPTAFLYFLADPREQNSGIYQEIQTILHQLIEPAPLTGGGEDMPETWRLKFRWRPADIIDVPDFEDAKIDPDEALAQSTEESDSEEESEEQAGG